MKIRRKLWADMPIKTNKLVGETISEEECASIRDSILVSEPISVMNLLKYEEFQVIKIN